MFMIKIYYSRFFCLSLFLLITFVGWAQSDDFTSWTKLNAKHKIDSRFAVSGNLEFRTKDDMSRIDRWGIAVGGDYRVSSYLKLETGYEMHYRNKGDSEWKFRYRYQIGASTSLQYQNWKFSLRERFQQTFDQGSTSSRLRSRLKMAYTPAKGIVSPYFSAELYQSIGGASFWSIARMRYRSGLEVELSKKWMLDLYYCRQYEPAKSKNIVGLEVSYSF